MQPKTPLFTSGSQHPPRFGHAVYLGEPIRKQMRIKNRKFNPSWLQLYSWLAFDGDGQYMYCTLCTNGKKVNGMMKGAKCTNFQKTTLDRHVSLYDHQMLLQAPELRQDLDTVKQECIEAGCCYESSF